MFDKKRGRKPVSIAEKRTHCVSIRLNYNELQWVDYHRGNCPPGRWLMLAARDAIPPRIPEPNRQLWADLARVGSNINQIAYRFNAGEFPELDEIREALGELRRTLLGAKR